MAAGALLFMLSAPVRTDVLTPEQQSYLEQEIRTQVKNDSDFRSVQAEWNEAHKVAEFLCRPVALEMLRKTLPEVDKGVRLENGKYPTLSLFFVQTAVY
ncbi:hypothetical protein OKV39_004637 [Salmonella enterica]|nr:hypothetical protein [Salmonella enterica]